MELLFERQMHGSSVTGALCFKKRLWSASIDRRIYSLDPAEQKPLEGSSAIAPPLCIMDIPDLSDMHACGNM